MVMDLTFRKRVHIMPVGYEFDRIVTTATGYQADQVVLIGHENDDEKGKKCWEKVARALDNQNIDYDTKRCNLFDLYSSLGTIAEAIANHEDDDVYVNVSSGSKITAIGGMIASMVLDATPYYVRADRYGSNSDFEELPTPKSVKSVTELPRYPINAPDTEEVVILEFISKYMSEHGPPTKGELIEFSERVELPYINQNVSGKGKYRLLEANIIEPLKEREYIEETKQGRNKILSLTSDGEAALEAFRWMVDTDIDWQRYVRDEVES